MRKSEIPADSLCRNYLPADYADVFSCEADTTRKIDPDDIMVGFWKDAPGWVGVLFSLRNFLVRFIGLRGSNTDGMGEFEECIRSGGTYNLISVRAKNDHETVLLLSDSHLDAHISLYVGDGAVSAITLVHFKNTLGRVYFFFIRPFHGIIVKSLLKLTVAKAMSK